MFTKLKIIIKSKQKLNKKITANIIVLNYIFGFIFHIIPITPHAILAP